MSPAVIAGNAIVSTIALIPSGVAMVTTTVLAPIAFGAALGAMAAAMEEASEKRRSEISLLLRNDISVFLETFQTRVNNASLSLESRKKLLNELAILKTTSATVADRIVYGEAVQREIDRIRNLLEEFGEKIAHHETKFAETKELVAFHVSRVRNYFTQMEESFSSDDIRLVQLKESWAEIQALPNSQMDSKLTKLSELSAKLGAHLDKAALTKMLSAPKSTKAGIKPSGPVLPKPPSPGRNRPSLGRVTKLKKAQQEVEFCVKRMKETFDISSEKLEGLASEAASSMSIERVLAIRDQITMEYQKTAEEIFLSNFFREKLKACQPLLDPAGELSGKVGEMAGRKKIRRDEFTPLFIEVEAQLNRQMEQKKRQLIQEKIREGLTRLDYVVIDSELEEDLVTKLSRGDIVPVDTKYDDYKLLIKVAPDQTLGIRLIRVTPDENEKNNISDFQKKKDQELLSEWCKNLDLLIEHLKDHGILMFEKLKIEDRVDYLTIEQLEQSHIDTARLKKISRSIPPRQASKKV